MSEIILPKKVVYGPNSLDKYQITEFSRLLFVSDCSETSRCGFVGTYINRYKKSISQLNNVVNKNLDKLEISVKKAIKNGSINSVIIFGSNETIERISKLCYENSINSSAVYSCGLISQISSHTFFPDEIILDSSLICRKNSDTVVYDAMTALACSLDAAVLCDKAVFFFAKKAAIGILQNIISAYRGDILSLKNLQYSMLYAAIAHLNSPCHSNLCKVSAFFSKFGYPEVSIAALCLPTVFENDDTAVSVLSEIYKCIEPTKLLNDENLCANKLIEEIRKIQAMTGMPRSVRAYGIPEDIYLEKAAHEDISNLLDNCYYGSMRFVKL